MLAPYRSVLSEPGALPFSAAGLVARLPISMLGLGTVLLVEAHTGAYAPAAAVAATLGVTGALAAPLLSRLVDRHGQARVLRPALAVNALGVVLLVVLAVAGAPLPLLLGCAVLAGAGTVSIGSLVRARWSRLLPGSPRAHTAYSLESALDELVFIVGPVLVTVLAARVSPVAGLLVAVVAALTGGYALAAQRRTEPPAQPREAHAGVGTLRSVGVVLLVAVFVVAGAIFGAIEVTTAAFAAARDVPAAAGAVLAVFAFGSMVAGLIYGAVHWRARADHRFTVAVVALAIGVVPCALVGSLPALAAVLLVAGFAISPMIVAGFALVEALVAPARLTEALTWTSTAIALGANLGVSVAGPVIDRYGAQRGYLIPVVCGAAAIVLVLTFRHHLVPRAATARGDEPVVRPQAEAPDAGDALAG